MVGEQVVVVDVEGGGEELDDPGQVLGGALPLERGVVAHQRQVPDQVGQRVPDQLPGRAGDHRVLLVGQVRQVVDGLPGRGEVGAGQAAASRSAAARASAAQASAPSRRA
ncbi:hypothetical protein ACFQV2_21610 [Actinokineospora soli]|uniref:Uncharacterized protein n=1 Tax=Actinokineospora soli TaxID=1048753 RepID=A0ABW2TQD0_9PSEU